MDPREECGLRLLDSYLSNYSYLSGYVPSQSDSVIFKYLGSPPKDKFINVLRWYNHIESFGSEVSSFPGRSDVTINQIMADIKTSEIQTSNDVQSAGDVIDEKLAVPAKKEAKRLEKLAKFEAKKAKLEAQKQATKGTTEVMQ